jgi:hypothetical protein
MGKSNPPSAPDRDVCIVPGDLNHLPWAIEQLKDGSMGNGTTIYVPGNHDFYRQASIEYASKLSADAAIHSNVFLANPAGPRQPAALP